MQKRKQSALGQGSTDVLMKTTKIDQDGQFAFHPKTYARSEKG